MMSRITTWLRHAFVWSFALLAIGVAVLWVRSYWRCDEAGYYSYKIAPQPSLGRDCRNLIGSWRGGVFWLGTEADVPVQRLDWYGGEPIEIILNSSSAPHLASAALETVMASAFAPVPRWRQGGFNLKGDRGQSPRNRWWYRSVVVPHWALFLLLAWAPALCLRQRWIRRQRRKRGLCLNCGYDVRASGEVCSECGNSLRKIDPAASAPRPTRRRRRAAAGLVVAGVALISLYVHGRGERSEAVVRLGPATTLPAGNLPRQMELEMDDGLSMRFALIPSGRFLMGSPPSEAGRGDDERQHEVLVGRPFYMGITEVTQEQYEVVMRMNPSHSKGPKNPVETVSWEDATAFCRRFSERSGRKVRLPTEAEWEYACRAGTTTPFYTGHTLPREMANYPAGSIFPSMRKGKSDFKMLPVGSFRPNHWGLYDMHGNAWEWCDDWAGSASDAHISDPRLALRVLRGGAWNSFPQGCRSAGRKNYPSVFRSQLIGFRCVLDPP
ncbi:MAG: formylglycine-generating enzyme family protein [Tepidisphaerales bacterium]